MASLINVLTIGTEITSGEVVNTNAAWISRQLEEYGLRVNAHLTVRDHRPSILKGLQTLAGSEILIVTGGLGPTSDDITRECLAEFTGCALEMDAKVWEDLTALYKQRGLTLREAHKQQCYFPKGSERLKNPVGTALGFAQVHNQQNIFVLPGPPRELEGIWKLEVEPRLKSSQPSLKKWVRWTCLGLPESEVAELVEPIIAGFGIEVGYRAAAPYVKVKLFAGPEEQSAVNKVEQSLSAHIVGRGLSDLAVELLQLWTLPELIVVDEVTDGNLVSRLFEAQRGLKTPRVQCHTLQGQKMQIDTGLHLTNQGDEFCVRVGTRHQEKMILPYKVPLSSERGKKSAAEWALWIAVKALRA